MTDAWGGGPRLFGQRPNRWDDNHKCAYLSLSHFCALNGRQILLWWLFVPTRNLFLDREQQFGCRMLIFLAAIIKWCAGNFEEGRQLCHLSSFVRINFKSSYHHVSLSLKVDYESSKMKSKEYDRSTWGIDSERDSETSVVLQSEDLL